MTNITDTQLEALRAAVADAIALPLADDIDRAYRQATYPATIRALLARLAAAEACIPLLYWCCNGDPHTLDGSGHTDDCAYQAWQRTKG